MSLILPLHFDLETLSGTLQNSLSSGMKHLLRKLCGLGFTNLVGSLNECTLRALNSLKVVNHGVQNDMNKVCLRIRPPRPMDYLQKLIRVVFRRHSLQLPLDFANFWF